MRLHYAMTALNLSDYVLLIKLMLCLFAASASPDVCVMLEKNLLQLPLQSVTLLLTGRQLLLQSVAGLLTVSHLGKYHINVKMPQCTRTL